MAFNQVFTQKVIMLGHMGRNPAGMATSGELKKKRATSCKRELGSPRSKGRSFSYRWGIQGFYRRSYRMYYTRPSEGLEHLQKGGERDLKEE